MLPDWERGDEGRVSNSSHIVTFPFFLPQLQKKTRQKRLEHAGGHQEGADLTIDLDMKPTSKIIIWRAKEGVETARRGTDWWESSD